MSLASVSIDRTALGKPPLVIASDGTTFRLTEEGVGQIVRSVRVTYAPDSINVDGSEPISFAREATSMPLEFHVIGASSAAVAASVAEVEEAVYRLDYPVTRTVDGVSVLWSGGPCALVPKRGVVDSGVLAQHFETYAVTIPLPNPHGTVVEEES